MDGGGGVEVAVVEGVDVVLVDELVVVDRSVVRVTSAPCTSTFGFFAEPSSLRPNVA